MQARLLGSPRSLPLGDKPLANTSWCAGETDIIPLCKLEPSLSLRGGPAPEKKNPRLSAGAVRVSTSACAYLAHAWTRLLWRGAAFLNPFVRPIAPTASRRKLTPLSRAASVSVSPAAQFPESLHWISPTTLPQFLKGCEEAVLTSEPTTATYARSN